MFDMTVKHRLPDIVVFSSTCFADTDLYQLQSSREFTTVLVKNKYSQAAEESNKKQCHNFGSAVGSIARNT